MKIKLLDKWNDEVNGTNDRFCELRIGTTEACCVINRESGLIYIMECYDGNDVYSWIGGADFPLRKLTPAEREEVVTFAKEQFEAEKEMDEREVM